MTSAIPVVTLTFDGTDIQVLFGLYLEITQGLGDSPDVRGIDVTVPGLAGQVPRPRKFHQRKLLLTGHLAGDGATEADRRSDFFVGQRAMLELFDAAADPAPLVATLPSGYTATVDARTLSVVTVEDVPGEWASLSIELLGVEDWLYEAIP